MAFQTRILSAQRGMNSGIHFIGAHQPVQVEKESRMDSQGRTRIPYRTLSVRVLAEVSLGVALSCLLLHAVIVWARRVQNSFDAAFLSKRNSSGYSIGVHRACRRCIVWPCSELLDCIEMPLGYHELDSRVDEFCKRIRKDGIRYPNHPTQTACRKAAKHVTTQIRRVYDKCSISIYGQ